jgi:hypothetical protein
MNTDNMIVFVAGMPRSGSTWTYNVLRRMIACSGKKPWPETIPPDQGTLVEKAFSEPAKQGYMYCIKVHCNLPLDRQNVRIFCNYRDIRDVTLSYMRFMKTSFEHALQVAKGCMSITDYYLDNPNSLVFPVDYDDIASCPEVIIQNMAEYLGLVVTGQQAEDIATKFSRDKIKEKQMRMRTLSKNKEIAATLPELTERYSRIQHGDGSYEMYDPETGFQSHHVTSNQEGEWRHAFTDEQQHILNELTHDWLVRYGYRV